MTILLLGKDGQLGWQLQRSLAPHGAVVAVGREQCDLSDLGAVRCLLDTVRPEVVVNAAAYTAVDQAEQVTDLAYRLNAELPGVLAERMASSGGLLLHYSTDYVFNGRQATPYTEMDTPDPLSVYGASKLAGERRVLESGGRALIFRSSWVFGARGHNFVKTILRLAQERTSLRVVDDQIGCPTPAALMATVSGLALGMVRHPALAWPSEPAIYHLAASGPTSWYGFAQEILRLASQTPGFALSMGENQLTAIPSQEYPTPAQRPLNSRLDCSRLEREFGLTMPDWRPYLARMMQLLSMKRNAY